MCIKLFSTFVYTPMTTHVRPFCSVTNSNHFVLLTCCFPKPVIASNTSHNLRCLMLPPAMDRVSLLLAQQDQHAASAPQVRFLEIHAHCRP